MNKHEVLNKYFGYKDFRYPQGEVIDDILMGKDTICVLPTGGGKSVIFQIPAVLFDGITLVITPLISLMEDQVRNLNRKKIKSCFINSDLRGIELKILYNKILQNFFKIIYISPERLFDIRFFTVISKINISFIALDEAHTILWGKDFRLSFFRISEFIKKIKIKPVIAAVTATATNETIELIREKLLMINPIIYNVHYHKKNVFLSVEKIKKKEDYILNFIKMNNKLKGIIYTSTRVETEKLYNFLKQNSVGVTYYHGGLFNDEKRANQDKFYSKDYNVMISTISFGLGIDIPNIRFIIIFNIPQTIEDLVQMIGRCSRDGNNGLAIILYNKQDFNVCFHLINKSTNNNKKLRKEKVHKLYLLYGLLSTKKCYNSYINNYFGYKEISCCQNCSNCCSEKNAKIKF